MARSQLRTSALALGLAVALAAGLVAALPSSSARAADGPRLISGWLGWWADRADASAVATRGGDVTGEVMQFMWAFNGPDDPACLIDQANGGACTTGATNRRYADIRDTLRSRGVTVYATHTDLNGSRKRQLSEYLSTADHRQALADLLAARAIAAGVDGVDLDWENMAFNDGSASWTQTRPRFVDFVARASRALHRAGKLLSVTVPGGYAPFRNGVPNDSGGYWVFAWSDIIGSIDRLRLMAYDYNVSKEGPVGPTTWADQVARSAVAQVGAGNADKVSLGVHQYGRDWVRTDAAGRYRTNGCPAEWTADRPRASRSLSAIRSIAKSTGTTPVWHGGYGEWYLDYEEETAGTVRQDGVATPRTCTAERRIWFGDQRTAQERLRLAGKYGLAGISVWNLGGIEDDFYAAGLSALAYAIGNDTRQPAGVPLPVRVAGARGVPAQAAAVVVNATVTDPAASGHLQIGPCGKASTTSVANFTAGQTVAATTIAEVSSDGRICLQASARAHLLLDVVGYFPDESSFAPRANRLSDTRSSGTKPAAGSVTRVAVPADGAAAVTVTVTEPEAPGWVKAYPCNGTAPETSLLNYAAGQTVANLYVGALGPGGQLCVQTASRAHLIVDLVGTLGAGADLVPRPPLRLLDSRRTTALAAGAVRSVPVPGAAAAFVNLTAVQPSSTGHLTVYPCGSAAPSTSALNYAAGRTVANAAFVEVGEGGRICLVSSAPSHVLVDITAAVASPPDFRSLAPQRLTDTRRGASPLAAGQTLPVTIPDRAAAAGATVTITGPDRAGYATVFPCGQQQPTTSNVNFTRGATVANSAIVAVGSANRVCVFSSARSHVIVDYFGYAPLGSRFAASSPQRLLDTRSGAPVQAGGERAITVPRGASTVVLNLTAVSPERPGHLVVAACGAAAPTSALNYTGGQIVANLAIAEPGRDGRLCIRTTSTAHILVDITGSFQGKSAFSSVPGRRLLDTRTGGALPAALTAHEVAVPDAATAVAVNLTVTQPRGSGYLQVWPCGGPVPQTSSANFAVGQTVAATIMVQPGAERRICARTSVAAHVLVDYSGFQSPMTLDPVPPVRLADTRS